MAYRRSYKARRGGRNGKRRAYNAKAGSRIRRTTRVSKASAPRRRLQGIPLKDFIDMGQQIHQAVINSRGQTSMPNLRGSYSKYRIPLEASEATANSSQSYAYTSIQSRGVKSLKGPLTGGVSKQLAKAVGQVTSSSGRQGTQVFMTHTVADLATFKTAMEAQMPVEFRAGGNSLRGWFGYCRQMLTFKSTVNHVLNIRIYDIVAKRSSNSIEDEPFEAWDAGMIDQGYSASPSHRFTPGKTPFESKQFNRFWKVVKTVNVRLEPGAEHTHIFKRYFNQIRNTGDWDQQSAGQSAVYGLTGGIMITMHGSLGHAATSALPVGVTIPQSVSYMPGVIDFAHDVEHTFQFAGIAPKRSLIATNAMRTDNYTDWDFMAENDDVSGDLKTA